MDHGSPRSTVETYDDIWEFEDKTMKFFELVSMFHYNLYPYLSLFGEIGISGASLGFNPDEYKTTVSTNESYPTTESANVRQPSYTRLLIRAGIELKIKRFRFYKKEPSKFLKTILFQ
jgi:hypothetical protein